MLAAAALLLSGGSPAVWAVQGWDTCSPASQALWKVCRRVWWAPCGGAAAKGWSILQRPPPCGTG